MIGQLAMLAAMMAPGILGSIPDLADLLADAGPKAKDRELARKLKRSDTLSNAMLLAANKGDEAEARRERMMTSMNDESRFNSMMKANQSNNALAMLAQFMGGGDSMMEQAAIKALGRSAVRGSPQGPTAYNPIDDF